MALFQLVAVGDFDDAAAVANQALCLDSLGGIGDGGPVYAQHLLRNSCVSRNSSRPTRSCVVADQRAIRASVVWLLLRTTFWETSTIVARLKRLSSACNVPSRPSACRNSPTLI